MDKSIRRYTDFEEMKADEYRYWQSRPIHERVAAVSELTQEHYALKDANHAQPRATKDLDILIKADAANARKVFAALAQFGAPLQGMTAADFAEPGPFFRMGPEPVGVDILTEIPGVDFDAAWKHRVEGVVDPASGLKASFISAEDLIAAKLATARPQDIADVDAIRKAQSRPARPAKKAPKDERP